MGWGDELMAAGEARKLHESNGLPVIIISGRDGRPRWCDLWSGNPYIVQRTGGKPYNRVISGGGVRPYIRAKTPDRWFWKPYTPTPAEVFFTDEERKFAEPYRGMVMVEPNVKDGTGHTNKAWIWERWAELALRVKDCGEPMLQVGAENTSRLPGTMWLATPTFRQAAAVLSVCKAFVGPEGGLMHAAAAVGTPGVILWSEFISAAQTGYSMHRNIRHAGEPCGMRTNCSGCRKAMDAITVDEVVQNLMEIL